MQINTTLDKEVHQPSHYLAGRQIEPMDVIEMWGLNHHLACALKYISRAGRKVCEKTDLEKAIWYLERWMNHSAKADDSSYMTRIQNHSPFEVSVDWELDDDLSMALTHLCDSTKSRNVFHVESSKKFIQNRLKNLIQNEGETEQ